MHAQDTAFPGPRPKTLLRLLQRIPSGEAKIVALADPMSREDQGLLSRTHSWCSALKPALCDAVSPMSLCCTAVSCIQARDQAAALRATSRWVSAPVCQALDAVTVESLLLGASSHAEQVRCQCKYETLCSKPPEQEPSAGPVRMLGSACIEPSCQDC